MTQSLGALAKSLNYNQRQSLLHGRACSPGDLADLVERGISKSMWDWPENVDDDPNLALTELGIDLRHYVQRRIKEGYLKPWE